MDLTNEQWSVLEPLIGELPKRGDGRGRLWRSSREVMNGMLWIRRTGAQWTDLPDRYPPYQTCHRRIQRWVQDATFERILEALARDLKEHGKLDLQECFIDGTFVVVNKGADAWESPSEAKAQNSWQWQTALVFLSPLVPPRLRPRKVTLVAPALDSRFLNDVPRRLTGDRAYDADTLDAALDHLGIEMIAPHRRGRTRPKTQGGRPLRRYRRRWKIKRLFA